MTVLGTLLSSSPHRPYSFARLRWPGRDTLFVVLLATIGVVPAPAVTMMPQFLIFRALDWIDTLRPLWVPAFFGSAFNIFLLRQFFLSIPSGLENAAKIDGCGPFGIYFVAFMLPPGQARARGHCHYGRAGGVERLPGAARLLSSPEKMPLAYALQLYQQRRER